MDYKYFINLVVEIYRFNFSPGNPLIRYLYNQTLTLINPSYW